MKKPLGLASARPQLGLGTDGALGLLVLLGTLSLAVAFHELAHDEAQAWNIARASDFPWQVLENARYEGHTPLWYLVLWPFTRTGNPVWLHIISVVSVLFVCAMLFRDRPFSMVGCLLVAFSHPLVYEYSTIARPYVLALALSALYGSVMRCERFPLIVPAAICGGIAMTSAFGVVLSVPLMGVALTESFAGGRRESWRSRTSACALYAISAFAAAAIVVLPLATNQFEREMISGAKASLNGVFHALTSPVFPQLNHLPFGLDDWASRSFEGRVTTLLASSIALLAVAIRLGSRPSALFGWFGCIVSMAVAVSFSAATAERHLSHLFMGALALVWARDGLRWRTRPGHDESFGRLPHLADFVLGMVLAYQCAIGLASVVFDVFEQRTPFREAASLVESRFAIDGVILNDYGYPAIALLAYLDRPAWQSDCNCVSRFSRWDLKRQGKLEHLLERWCRELGAGRDTLVITGREKVLNIDGVVPLAKYPPGHRDPVPEWAHLVVSKDSDGVCGGAGGGEDRG